MGSLVGVKVGDSIFVKDAVNGSRYGDRGRLEVVTKVGRTNVYTNRHTWDINTGDIKDNYGYLCAWLTEDDYKHASQLSRDWNDFREFLHGIWSRPVNLTTEQMDQIREMLKP